MPRRGNPLLAMTVEGCQVENIGHSEGEAETPNGVSALLNFRRRRGSDLHAGLDPWESVPLSIRCRVFGPFPRPEGDGRRSVLFLLPRRGKDDTMEKIIGFSGKGAML